MTTTSPPRWARALVSAASDPRERRFILADLDEDFLSISLIRGPAAARHWYRSQVIRSVPHLVQRRIKARLTGRSPGSRWKPNRNSSHKDRLKLDVTFAFRTLRKKPMFTTVAVATLAIGIGGNTAIFSVVNGVLFKPIPGLENAEGLVQISRTVNGRWTDMSYPVFAELRDRSETMEDIVAYSFAPVSVTETDGPRVHMALTVTGNYFTALRLQPAMGRFFTPDEWFYPNVPAATVIGHRLWVDMFDSDPGVIGRSLSINGRPVEIIGVAPAGFDGHVGAARLELYLPLGVDVPGLRGADLENWQSGVLELMGVLAQGYDHRAASTELSALALRYATSQRDGNAAAGYDIQVDGWGSIPGTARGAVVAVFTVVMALVGLILATACINLANMMLSRGVERRQEIGIRLALGAGRGRLIRQLLTESMILVAVGGACGVLFAVWLIKLLLAFEPPLPQGIIIGLDFGIDVRVVVFSILISVTAGLAFSLIPARRSTNPDILTVLQSDSAAGSPARSRMRSLLMVAQMAVTVFLLTLAGLFVRSLEKVKSLDQGWDATGVYVSSIDLEYGDYSREAGSGFHRELVGRVAAIPGVETVGLAARLPLGGRSSLGDVNVAGVEPPPGQSGYRAYFNTVSPGYLETLRLDLVAGRDIDDRDLATDPAVAIINEAMARRFWPEGNAVGKTFYAGQAGTGTPFEVIGVVENATFHRIGEEPDSFYYLPLSQRYNPQVILHARITPGNERAAVGAIRETVAGLDPNLPVLEARSMENAMSVFLLPQRLAAWVGGTLGLVGLLLGAVGLSGTAAFAVNQRRREIGVRIALGARQSEVLAMVMRQALVAPTAGTLIGLVAALGAGHLLSLAIPGMNALDTRNLAIVAMVISPVLFLATMLPARRAVALDPVATLRSE